MKEEVYGQDKCSCVLKNIWRVLLLASILVVPLAVFLFLHGFGDNQFDLPIRYEDGISEYYDDCNTQDTPHKVPDLFPYQSKGWVVHFPSEQINEQIKQLKRVYQLQNDHQELDIISVFSDSSTYGKYKNALEWNSIVHPGVEGLLKCNFGLTNKDSALLVDENLFIRGAYYIEELEDTDRLITEINILKLDE